MATTYEPLATTTLSSAAASITFSSISSAYTDLRVVLAGTSDATGAGQAVLLRFNSDTATNYSATRLSGNGSAASSARFSNVASIYCSIDGLSTTIPILQMIDIFSYTGSTYKTTLISNNEDKNGSGYVEVRVGLWRSTSAITSVSLFIGSGNFATGTTATLYGILKA